MEAPSSFAFLAARLAASVAEIRPVDGAEVSWANFMALFVCAILEMLILLCEALDARAAVGARLVAAPAARDAGHRPVLAVRPEHPAMPGAGRVLRLVRADDAPSTAPKREAVLAGTAEAPSLGARPTSAPPWAAPCWRPPRIAISPRKRAPTSKVRHVYVTTIT